MRAHSPAGPRARLHADTLEYAELAAGALAALRPLVAAVDDAVALAAMRVLEHGAEQMRILAAADSTAATRRVEVADGAAPADRELRDKARRLITDSRRAWTLLTRPRHAVGNGLPTAMVRRLDRMEAALTEAHRR